jgi:hypothetical protein
VGKAEGKDIPYVSESLAFSANLSKRQVENRDFEIFANVNQGNRVRFL